MPSASRIDKPAAAGDPSEAQAFSDVVQAYRLILGVEPEPHELVADAGKAPAELVAKLFASERFRARIDSALARSDTPREGPLSVSVLHWARRAFGVEAGVGDDRLVLLRAVMVSDPVVERLEANPSGLFFVPKVLAELLRGEVREPGAEHPLHDRLERDFRGLRISRIQDMEPAGERRVRFTSGDPALILYFDPEVVRDAPAVEVIFAVSGARKRAQGTLYIAYETGFTEERSILLSPRGRRQYSALLLAPGTISNLRWDPDDTEGEAVIASITVRRLSFDELSETLGYRLPAFTAALVAPAHERSGRIFDLTAELTRSLYEHGSVDRSEYANWIEEYEPSPIDAPRVWARALEALESRPLISILVPTYETPAALLQDMIESVLAQVYPAWELCIADDASKSPHVREIIESYQAQDDRIKAVFRKQNGHISEASNSALELVSGEWFALLDHDDVLTPDALLAVAAEIEAHPDAQFIYSDEDKLDAAGTRYEPFFKPDFSPELLRSQNYLNHLSVHRTANVRAVGGWRKGFEGSQDYDLNLRTLEGLHPSQVRHIPKVLYHWRAVEGSTAKGGDQKSYAFLAGLRALEDHLERLEWDAEVQEIPNLPFYRVRYALPEPAPLVSLIIPTRDRADLVEVCVRSILERTDYDPYEVLIVDNGSVKPETFALFDELTQDPRVRIVKAPGPFNYSRINNLAVAQSRGAIVGLVNNDIEVITPDWMREMASWAAQPRIGCVGAKLYYPNDTIQHAGVVLGVMGLAGHAYKHHHRDDPGYFGHAMVTHDVSAVTAACLFIRREVYDEVEGLDEKIAVAFNDVDFCIRVREAGYRNLFTPFAELYHHESVSRGTDEAPEQRARFLSEVAFMHDRWPEALALDPFYSPNLTTTGEDFRLRALS